MKASRIIMPVLCLAMAAPLHSSRGAAPAEQRPEPASGPTASEDFAEALVQARARGLDWLTKHQSDDGSWGKTYTVAVTSFACLSYLSASDEPYAGPHAKALVGGLTYLMKAQTNGQWPKQGHSWIHGQGFATLALSEAVGRALFCRTSPDMSVPDMRKTVAAAVKVIATNQSHSGGWWYTPGAKGSHEGSTTVCAVQALVSAANFGIKIDDPVLDKGFEYLKRCQNKDGGFDYKLDNSPNTRSMKEGTAGGVATLGLMRKFDYAVMMNGYKFLLKMTPAEISKARFPYYGHFYGCMGMRLLGQEFKTFKEATAGYTMQAQKDIVSFQGADGGWLLKGWMKGNRNIEAEGYATSFATLLLWVDDGRLSIYNRNPPKLPSAS